MLNRIILWFFLVFWQLSAAEMIEFPPPNEDLVVHMEFELIDDSSSDPLPTPEIATAGQGSKQKIPTRPKRQLDDCSAFGLCSTCSETECLTCIDESNMDKSDGKCKCKTDLFWDSETSTCVASCKDTVRLQITIVDSDEDTSSGHYFDGNNCVPCDTKCKECEDITGKCTTCSDNIRIELDVTSCCDKGYYYDGSDCLECPGNCEECEDTTGECIACKNNFRLELDVTSCCDRGYYYDGSDCQKCPDNCEECEDTTGECMACSNYFRIELDITDDTCCETGTYYDGTSCVSCGPHCLECEDYTGTCLSCDTTVRADFDITDCACNAGYYMDEQGDCQKCGDWCSECEDITGECLSCDSNLRLEFDVTGCACNAGYYMDEQGDCQQCKENCEECEDITGDCLSCNSALRLELDITECACNAGYYMDDQGQCQPCRDNCKECEDITGNCLDCSNTLRLEFDIVGCECGSGYYTDDQGQCQPCRDNCKECEDITGDCLDCSNTLRLEFDIVGCECGSGYYTDDQGQCQPCRDNCKECEDITGNCLDCSNTLRLEFDIVGCECGSGYYTDDQGQCQPCRDNCKECEDITGNCLDCNSALRLEFDIVGCGCGSGYYTDDQGQCQPCRDNCKECEDITGNCLDCSNTLRLEFDINGCGCDSGYYENSQGQCQQCSDNCTKCEDITGKCLSCNNGTYSNNSTCLSCDPMCKLCDDFTGNCTKCLTDWMIIDPENPKTCKCNDGFHYNGTECATCGDGKYFNDNTCLDCDPKCKWCDDYTANCVKCKADNMSLDPDNPKTCKCDEGLYDNGTDCTTCSNGQYYDGATCVGCDSKCSLCNDFTGDCTKCISDGMIPDPENPKTCKCDQGYYSNGIDCLSCGQNCTTCEDYIGCTSCDAGLYYNGEECAPCGDLCSLCEDNTGACTSCIDSQRMEVSEDNNKVCVCKGSQVLEGTNCSCSSGDYFDGSSCSPCHDKCAKCNDFTAECVTCKDEYKMGISEDNNQECECLGTQTFDGDNCVCAEGQFNGTTCAKCGHFCYTCDDSSLACDSCIDNSRMKVDENDNKICSCIGNQTEDSSHCFCNKGTYFNSGVGCSPCEEKCLECTDYTGACTQCESNFRLELTISDCSSCSPGTYDNGETCVECDEFCTSCEDHTGKCTECENNFRIEDEIIDDSNCGCGSHKYYDGSSCTECPEFCIECEDYTGECSSCENNFRIEDEVEYVACCSTGYYYDGSQCLSCGDFCASCEDETGVCLSCSDESRMEISQADNTICVCKGSQIVSEGACSCSDGFYFDGETCSQCGKLCDSCEDTTGNCKTCVENAEVSTEDSKVCKCKGTSHESGSSCYCADGEYYDGSNCQTCDSSCTSCKDNTAVCISCIDNDRMYPNTKGTTCKCKGSQTQTDNTCSCKDGTYFSKADNDCKSCGKFCNKCDDFSGTCTACNDSDRMQIDGTKCSCKGSQLSDATKCYCSMGSYYDSETCSPCGGLCASCLDITGSCAVCSDTTRMSVKSDETDCECTGTQLYDETAKKCYCPEGTWNGHICLVCTQHCSSCDENDCLQCNDGYFYNSGTKTCDSCESNCAKCTKDACSQCKYSSMIIDGTDCKCQDGTYFDGTTCATCGTLCDKCTSLDDCSSCLDDTTMAVSESNPGTCACLDNKVYNGTACANCGAYCDECDSTTKVCTTCPSRFEISSTSDYDCKCIGNQLLNSNLKSCYCYSGYYFDNKNCERCGDKCKTCEDYSKACSACINKDRMVSNADGSCSCKGSQLSQGNTCYCASRTYFDGSTCANCPTHCEVCSDTTGKCTSCIDSLMTLDTTANTCTCPSSYYFDGKQCMHCDKFCTSCEETTGKCLTCQDSLRMDLVDGKCSCKGTQAAGDSSCYCSSGYFDGSTCSSCSTFCSTCKDFTGECTKCIDTSNMAISTTDTQTCACKGNLKTGDNKCYCDDGFFLKSAYCYPCSDPDCHICTASKQCSQCKDLSNYVNGYSCESCPVGYYSQQDGKTCAACGSMCAQCSSYYGCTACIDPTKMQLDSNGATCSCKGSQVWNGSSCYCNSGTYFDGETCESCLGKWCATCDANDGHCQYCYNNYTMQFSATNNHDCECKGNQITGPYECSCGSSSYFNGTWCAGCTDSGCGSCSKIKQCDKCLDLNNWIDGYTCKSASSGYYAVGDGVHRKACGKWCTSCEDVTGQCLTCKDTAKMELSTSNAKNCMCIGNQLYNNSACYCAEGTYFDGSNCVECGNWCSKCKELTGECEACKDTSKMEISATDKNTCTCKGSQVAGLSGCSCPDGQYFDNASCAACGSQCSKCSDYTAECTTCSEPDRAEVDPANHKQCICLGSQTYNGANCACETGLFNGTTCSKCGHLCDDCDPSTFACNTCYDAKRMIPSITNSIICECIGNQILSGSSCACSDSYYFNEHNCVSCGSFCDKCDDFDGKCTSCSEPQRMKISDSSLACECIGNQTLSTSGCSCTTPQEFFNGAECAKCPEFCKACDDFTGKCTSCVDSSMTLDTTLNTCSCQVGHFFKSGQCVPCGDFCSECNNYDGACTKCKNSDRMVIDPEHLDTCKCAGNQELNAGICSCEVGRFFNGSYCLQCGDLCHNCEDKTGTCLSCNSSQTMVFSDDKFSCHCIGDLQPDGDTCTCSSGWFDGAGCANCGNFCNKCDFLSGACTECTDPARMKLDVANDKACICKGSQVVEGLSCVCPNDSVFNEDDCIACETNCGTACTGATYYDSTTQSCKNCEEFCVACSDQTTCTQCSDPNTMIVDPLGSGKCICKESYYLEGSTCLACGTLCGTCNSDECLICENIDFIEKDPDNVKACRCTDGHVYNYQTKQCEDCGDSCSGYCGALCSSCDTTHCTECLDVPTMIADPNDPFNCKCTQGNYYDLDWHACTNCGTLCKNCDSSTNCLECVNPTTMVVDPIDSGSCICSGAYYSQGTDCLACGALCKRCSATKCLDCEDIVNVIKDPSNANACKCIDGYSYHQDTNTCHVNCGDLCSSCSETTCTICIDTILMVTDPINPLNCVCMDGYYYDTVSKSCKACGTNCALCTSETLCTSCKDALMIVNQSQPGTCKCKSGTYEKDGQCSLCSLPCTECNNSSNLCSACQDDMTLDKDKGLCSCKDAQYYNTTSSACKTCPERCTACTGDKVCTKCVENAGVISTGLCSCNAGYFSLSGKCTGCPDLCETCESQSKCLTCKTHASIGTDNLCHCNTQFTENGQGSCTSVCNNLCTSCTESDGNNCTACITNAELSNTVCSCTANSAYDSVSKSCACNAGYTLTNKKCVTCKKYLSINDIKKSSFSSSWAYLYVYFNVKIDTTLDSSCSKVIASDSLEKLGTDPACSWADSKTLRIGLGVGFTQRTDSAFSLDGTYIVKATDDPCTTQYQPLSVTPTATSNPAPTAKISGPASISISCASDPLIYTSEKSTGSLGSVFIYTWSADISPANSALATTIAANTLSSLTIYRSSFSTASTTTLKVTLKITNTLSLSSNETMTTTIFGGEALTVSFDQGNSVSMKASDSKTLKAKVTSLCGDLTSPISWQWSYVSGPEIDSASILANGGTTSKLTISANSLKADSTLYVFMAIGTQTSNGVSVSGNATISISVTTSQLFIKLSKNSGEISPSQDYTIDASGSYDPDDSTLPLSYSWTCVNNGDGLTCLGSDSKTLLNNEVASSITIPKSRMVKGAAWDITCTISKDTRSSSLTINLSVLKQDCGTQAWILSNTLKLNPHKFNKYIANIVASLTAVLIWTQRSGNSIPFYPNYLSTIGFQSKTLSEGVIYGFDLSVTDAGVTLTISLSISVNQGAACTGDLQVNIEDDMGSALINTYKLSIDGCYDLDGEDLPILYNFQDVVRNKVYTLGYATESNSVSTYLFYGKNQLTAHVCDQLGTCSDYSKTRRVKAFNRRLLTDSLYDSYVASTLDSDNIPSSISLYCDSATVDSELFSKMWSDLQSYVSSETDLTDSQLDSVLAAVYAMTSQDAQMTLSLYKEFMNWLDGLLTTYTSLTPTQDNMDTLVSISDRFMSYGNSTNYTDQSLVDYVIYANDFVLNWASVATKDDLVNQTSLNGNQNTDQTKIFKYRNFPTDMQNSTITLGTNRTVALPSKLDYASTDIMNMRALYFNASSDDYSDVVSLSFSLSGNYSDNTMNYYDSETYAPFSSSDYPVTLELPINKNLSEGSTMGCLYYNETSKTWNEEGCKVLEVTSESVIFEVYHFSMFKLGEAGSTTPPPDPFTGSSSTCGDNYAPIYILVVTLFMMIILSPIMVLFDRAQKVVHDIQQTHKKVPMNSPMHTSRPTEMALMGIISEYSSPDITSREEIVEYSQDSSGVVESREIDLTENSYAVPVENVEQVELSRGEEAVEPEENSSDFDNGEDVVNSHDIDLTENSFAAQVAGTVEKTVDYSKTELQALFEGHLTFGIFYYRPIFTRWTRLFTLVTVLLFELLLEGLLLFGFEDISSGSVGSTQTLFDDYEGNYLGYTILAIAIAIPIEIWLIIAFSIDRTKAPHWPAFGIVLGAAIIIGSIIGIVMLSFIFCQEWSGYWAICFLWSILIEIFVMQTIYMIARYFILESFPQEETTKVVTN